MIGEVGGGGILAQTRPSLCVGTWPGEESTGHARTAGQNTSFTKNSLTDFLFRLHCSLSERVLDLFVSYTLRLKEQIYGEVSLLETPPRADPLPLSKQNTNTNPS